ncbi:MAG TPA: DNA-directed RNA polymerase subunit beta', partial [Candidatus Krumholzibacteriaceae bacterium]|nr:DNA-directed RNA polymerase subunit beta' [Candidatus Krumholzibacteriaceae bacterium]
HPGGIDAMGIKLASPEAIRSWSYGEVLKPETINYRSFKPEKDGLFCERIFGPVKDWECACGKYKRIRYRGVICDRCGVEVTHSKVRRERMGHIELAVPVAHIWFLKGIPSRIGYMLGISIRNLERILYYESRVVIDPGESGLEHKQLIDDETYYELVEKEVEFTAKMGGMAIRELLAQVDIEEESINLRAQAKVETSMQRKKKVLKRLRVMEAFLGSPNKAEWMILETIPVLPPDLRPLVPLEGGRFATSDLNDLYRRVINRNNRLKKLIEIRAPEVILRNEKRMLQEAVDALFDNGRRSRPVRGHGNRPLKSLSDMLKGKKGRFRQNLLGKRVDYSGRSVIVVGPELEMHQCGIPKSMALELFKPFIIRKLEEKGYVQTVKSAKKLVERERPEVWDILEEIIKDHPVLLNRAPTLHKLGVQGFHPTLIEGKAIQIHPLVCAAFNADFDGDQMAVHVPLSLEAQLEARTLMLSSNNIMSPANGGALATPSQDMVLGSYYLSASKEGVKGEGKIFFSPREAIMAKDMGVVDIHALIKVRINGELLETTVGRLIFNSIVPEGLGFVNDLLDKSTLNKLIAKSYKMIGNYATVQFLERLKETGFNYATKAGITFGVDDIVVPPKKSDMIQRAEKEIEKILKQYSNGVITDGERYNKVIDIWTHTTNEVAERMDDALSEDKGGFNPIYMMANSGSRGSKDQIRQLAGMRGLMAKPQKTITGGIGEIIEMPITANFKEGLSVLQYFISTHGARKGLADTALKTADAGYLTRRLVDVAQDVIITEYDCGTIRGINASALKEGEEVIESLSDRILGRVAIDDVVDPHSGEVLAEANSLIDEDTADEIEERGVLTVKIRSVLTCEAERGTCALCYGSNIASGKMVDLGEAVGVVAAQSIGEPGTQLTLRTFHVGGTASRIAETTQKTCSHEGYVKFNRIKYVEDRNKETKITGRKGEVVILSNKKDRVKARFGVPYGAILKINEGDKVKKGQIAYEWDPYSNVIISHKGGKLRFRGIVEGVTLNEKLDDKTGLRQRIIEEDRDKKMHPHIEMLDNKGKIIGNFIIPTGARLVVHDGDDVLPGDVICRIPKEITKTHDITGGLPRVAQLFEVRKPKAAAIVSEIDGNVKFGAVSKGIRKIVVENESGDKRTYSVAQGKHLRVYEGDTIEAGDNLTEGPVNPFDILNIKGVNAVQEYLVNEIQEVYRLQGVHINDKHIEVIVSQMLQKVLVEDPGSTDFLEGDVVSKKIFEKENEKARKGKGTPATFKPLLLGITKASLSTDSYISAASFQETTRVLTDAATQGKVDKLHGLKENVVMGHLIPAGTGMRKYKNIELVEDVTEQEIMERDFTEEELSEMIDDMKEGAS